MAHLMDVSQVCLHRRRRSFKEGPVPPSELNRTARALPAANCVFCVTLRIYWVKLHTFLGKTAYFCVKRRFWRKTARFGAKLRISARKCIFLRKTAHFGLKLRILHNAAYFWGKFAYYCVFFPFFRAKLQNEARKGANKRVLAHLNANPQSRMRNIEL